MEQAQEGQRGQEHRLDRRLEGCRKGSVSQVSGILAQCLMVLSDRFKFFSTALTLTESQWSLTRNRIGVGDISYDPPDPRHVFANLNGDFN